MEINEIPFRKEQQLCQNLEINHVGGIQRRDTDDGLKKANLPGFPRIRLYEPEMGEFLNRELVTERLNTLAPYLWLVSRQDSSHIAPLTDQVVRGRSIIVTEKPELHLLQTHSRIFIKPLPKFLLSHAFWEHYLSSPSSPIPKPVRQDLRDAAVGLIRSYSYLITHESDYTIAQDETIRLVPKGIPYARFIEFVDCFAVSDEHVSSRFVFGELSLAKVNFLTILFLRDSVYDNTGQQRDCTSGRRYAAAAIAISASLVLLVAFQIVRTVQRIFTTETADSSGVYGEFSPCNFILKLLFISVVAFIVLGAVTRELIPVLQGLREKREISSLVKGPSASSSKTK